jgi:hypothetical protein
MWHCVVFPARSAPSNTMKAPRGAAIAAAAAAARGAAEEAFRPGRQAAAGGRSRAQDLSACIRHEQTRDWSSAVLELGSYNNF